ncbi:asparagine synthase-related protein [Jeotgalibacillus proteolyticus]|uniref:asparagine synthase (glutamine-hydrolyzing) n=1 Tax=Jeotgalibacillus proteolyticus TaxID=2082395 RepID=A0A2S5G8A9_9BACL|nr:asparagine synthase-related protein [Jeotgalibacillus proteolyticus]PPA69226.1 asparagine synthetase B [Jeotgalibacillus proteolyticus]
MSAITGIYHINSDPVSIEQSQLMMKSYEAFPSDDRRTWVNKNLFLGCHAQWITLESVGEILPAYDDERKLAITADAIIDNRDELFTRLGVKKEERSSMPDSRLILLAYSKWGEEVPEHLKGDFAFMIWDEKKQRLFSARDFSGARTLYFYHNEARFAFSTLIEPLFTLPYIKKELNEDWLAEFIAIPTMVEAVDMLSTVYKGIRQLPPSHRMTVTKDKISISRYSLLDGDDKLRLKSNDEYEEAFREVLQKAVKARIRTHGEVGSHLSGGLDSGSVVSFAADELKQQNKRLHTFSAVPLKGFQDWTDPYYVPNESPFIKETVRHVGNIKDHYLPFDEKSPLTEVDDFLELMEMPYKFFENTFWLKGINQEAQQKGVKVMLNGSRGNHSISWGSMTLTYNFYAQLFKRLRWMKLYIELDAYCRNFKTGKSVLVPFVAKRAFPKFAAKVQQEHYQFPVFINPALAERTKVFEKLEANGMDQNGIVVHNLSDYRRTYYNQPFVWNKSGVASTKLSLRYSLWDRDPTNDIDVIRFCLAIPEEQYTTNGMDRSLIRRAMKGYLPDRVRMNQSTRGLQGADVIQRMTSNWTGFIEEIEDMLKNQQLAPFIDLTSVKNSFDRLGREPRPEMITEDEFKVVTRSLIIHRFLKQFD